MVHTLKYWHCSSGLDCWPHWSRDQDLGMNQEEEEGEEGEEEEEEREDEQPEGEGEDSGGARHQRGPNRKSRIDEEEWSTGYSLRSP